MQPMLPPREAQASGDGAPRSARAGLRRALVSKEVPALLGSPFLAMLVGGLNALAAADGYSRFTWSRNYSP